MIQETEKIEKILGGTIFHTLSAFNPAGSFWVRCDRHPEQYTVKVDHNYFDIAGFDARGTILDQAIGLLAQCPTCVEEKKPKPMCAQEEHDACGCQQ